MPFVRLVNVSLSASVLKTAAAVERRGIDLTFGPGFTGLVGRNGSGKTTLLKCIAGRSETGTVTGELCLSGPVRLLDQTPDPASSVAQLFGCADALQDLEHALAGTPTKGAFDDIDWTLGERLAAQLSRFGLDGVPPGTLMGQLSGGQQLRTALAAVFFDAPDIVLLDEPTNNLDAEGQKLVRQCLAEFDGVAIVASHDRRLLEMADRIVSLDPDGGARTVGGGWSVFAADQARATARLQHDAAQIDRHVRQLDRRTEEAAARQARRARQGKSLRDGSQSKMLLDKARDGAESRMSGRKHAAETRRAAALADQQGIARQIEVITPIAMSLPDVIVPSGKRVLTLEQAVFGVGRFRTAPISFSLTGPERVQIRGVNGTGKSTLMRGIMGRLPPVSGQLTLAVPVAMLDQDGGWQGQAGSLLEAAQTRFPQAPLRDIRTALAQAGFRGTACDKPITALSGGELLRAALGLIACTPQPPGLLLLDEPTNHLDLAALAALEAALKDWRGALIFVSHDAEFAENLRPTRVISLEPA
nr:ATP-binding cassette domain-containing protein [uncultured Celeribacter sp.]